MKRTELSSAARLCAQHLDRERPVLAAVSGGLDSMCLAHFLYAQGYRVSCAHFNHRLRGEEADRDEAFVRAWCEQNGIPFFSSSGDVRAHARKTGESIEEAARTLRYAFLRETAQALHAQLALAHHADDNAETVLLNLIRGTDLRGLCAMQPVQNGIVRPFLELSRAELAAYAAENGIPHIEDSSNEDPAAAARNCLRLEILPRLKTINPRANEHIAATARSLSTLDDALTREADAALLYATRQENRISLPLDRFCALSPAVQPRVLLAMAETLGIGRKDIGRSQLEAVCALAQKKSRAERRYSLPRGAFAVLADGMLTLQRAALPPHATLLSENIPLRWGSYELTLLPSPEGDGLSLRLPGESESVFVSPCPPSARLTLPGANGARSVKRLCIDQRIPLSSRDSLPALYFGAQLAAVWPLGADVSFLPQDGRALFVRIRKI